MKRDFQAKFLMHMAARKQEKEGFTLIELLVVIIIIGILAAIALPSLLGQVNKAKQSEARNNVGAMNRAQQAYILGSSDFTSDIAELGIGIQQQSANYYYDIEKPTTPPTGGDILAVSANRGTPLTTAKTLKTYGGPTFMYRPKAVAGKTSEALTVATVCELKEPLAVGTAGTAGAGGAAYKVGDAKYDGKQIDCGKDYKNLGSDK